MWLILEQSGNTIVITSELKMLRVIRPLLSELDDRINFIDGMMKTRFTSFAFAAEKKKKRNMITQSSVNIIFDTF